MRSLAKHCLHESVKQISYCSQFQYYIYGHILASLHFNENHREKELSQDGRTYQECLAKIENGRINSQRKGYPTNMVKIELKKTC